MKTHNTLIITVLFLQILFANMTFAQKITAEYNEDGSGIIVYNQTKNEIYIFEESKNSFVKGKETHCSQEVDIQEIKSIEGCDFFEYAIKDGKKDPKK